LTILRDKDWLAIFMTDFRYLIEIIS